jgi:enoyl-CoA hydratase/carnithine racemase
MELILTGESATAIDMERYGIVNKIVSIEHDVVDEAIKTATRIATFSAPAVGLAKQAVKAGEQHAHDQLQYVAKKVQLNQLHWKRAWKLSAHYITAVSRLWTVRKALQRS